MCCPRNSLGDLAHPARRVIRNKSLVSGSVAGNSCRQVLRDATRVPTGMNVIFSFMYFVILLLCDWTAIRNIERDDTEQLHALFTRAFQTNVLTLQSKFYLLS